MLQTSLASSRCTMLACRPSCLGPEVQGRGKCCYLRGPHEMLACASLMRALFPAAWPLSGAAQPGLGNHARHALMPYRAAPANCIGAANLVGNGAAAAVTRADSRCHLQGPHEMLACASLLGDLFPAAWPPSGAARPGQGSHAPPAHRRYRAALAKSFEPSTQEALRSLMACAAASESLIFRAALVRLCARASGTLLRRNGAYVSLCWPPRTEVAR